MSEDVLITVAKLMELSARTAPKAVGQDYIEIKILCGEDKDIVGKEMLKIGEKNKSAGFNRDGQNVLHSQVLVMIGLLKHPGIGMNCGACGYETCSEFSEHSIDGIFLGPNCAHRLADLGIAIGSAVKTASMHNADNRVMYRAGNAARALGIMKSNIVYGIPLSGTGKNIFFDRKPI